ncbi:MAG: ACP S-malonyltransferase, partial [Thermotoga sp.]|nr:ACP S-malonyltransferase [Thermotoga sp.]
HTPFLEYASERMKEEVEKIAFKKPKWPIVMNSTAEPTEDPEEIKKNVIEQITGPVLWKQSVDTMKRMGVEEFVEVGPKTVLRNLCKRMGVNAVHFTELLSG